jgi:hypothetical protein
MAKHLIRSSDMNGLSGALILRRITKEVLCQRANVLIARPEEAGHPGELAVLQRLLGDRQCPYPVQPARNPDGSYDMSGSQGYVPVPFDRATPEAPLELWWKPDRKRKRG